MRTTLFTLAALLLGPLAALCAADAPPVQRPNILFITAEDIYPNLGCHGDANAVTPNLDRFAKEGVRFNQCYSVHPCCSPSRSAIVTGVYPTRLGTFQHRAKMWVNPDLVKCFPTLLRAAGYYIRNFMPLVGWDAIQYSWQKAPFMLHEWGEFAQYGKIKLPNTRQACFFRNRKPVEELYDMQADPWQLHNLAGDPQQQATLERLRGECERWMVENRDLGLLSQYELYARSEPDSPLETGKDPKRNPIQQLLSAANLANQCDAAAIPRLCELLKADDGAVRRWGVIGLLALGAKAAPATESLRAALQDPAPDVRMTAAETLCGLGHVDEAVPVLITLLSDKDSILRHETLLALCRIGPAAKAALPHLDKARAPGARHTGIWSFDNVVNDIPLARACLGGGTEAEAKLKLTRQKYLP